MSSSDSMFLFEIAVEELKSYTECKNYRILAKFCHVFSLRLRDPNETIAETLASQRMGKKSKRKLKLRQGKLTPPKLTVPPGQTVLIASDIESLVTNMMKYPLELTIFSKEDRYTLGLAEIPWSTAHFDYLKNLNFTGDQPPAIVTEKHRVYDEYTSKRIAIVKLKIQLALLKEPIPIPIKQSETMERTITQQESFESNYKSNPFAETGDIKTYYSGKQRKAHSPEPKVLKLKESVFEIIDDKKEIFDDSNPPIETIVDARANETIIDKQEIETIIDKQENETFIDKQEHETYKQEDTIERKDDIIENVKLEMLYAEQNTIENVKSEALCTVKSKIDQFRLEQSPINFLMNVEKNDMIGNDTSLASFVRSQTKFDNNKLFAVTKHWSSTSLEIKQRLDTLNYIFGNLDGPFGNKVYCVGYFTVENETASDKTGTTPNPNTNTSGRQTSAKESGPLRGSGKYSFKVCGSECKLGNSNPCFENVCKLDLPDEAAHLINVRKCTRMIECENKRERGTLSSSDEPILIDLAHRNIKDCCQNVEQVIGGMQAEMKIGDDPCFCTCSCTFGFVKKTTYCDICGGYELVGDEVKSKRPGPPFPCPYYHNLLDKGKKPAATEPVSTTTKRKAAPPAHADKDKRASEATKRSVDKESDKESKKGKKKKKDDRFKFNYGYKAPQIGHSQCALPCSGNLLPVPKHMGWLWTADNIPGLKAPPYGWRPGAISKRLLQKLNQAKMCNTIVAARKRTKKLKKPSYEEKPTLIVAKRNGEYIVEMQVYNEDSECNEQASHPLIYKIASANNEEKVRRRELKTQRLIEKTAEKVWSDPYHPEVCETTCLKAYKQAMGILPYDANNPECICPEDMESEYSEEEVVSYEEDSSDCSSLDLDWELHFTPPAAYKF